MIIMHREINELTDTKHCTISEIKERKCLETSFETAKGTRYISERNNNDGTEITSSDNVESLSILAVDS